MQKNLNFLKTIINKLIFLSNKFFSLLAHTRGKKHQFLLSLSIIIKIPVIIFYYITGRIPVSFKMNKREFSIYKDLNKFGFSYSDKIEISQKLLQEVHDSFYRKYQNKRIDNNQILRFPIEYLPIEKDLKNSIYRTIEYQLKSVISNYLFHMPYCKKVCFMYSRNNQIIENSSQYWHLDKTGPKTLKIFITLHETNQSHGVLKFINSSMSRLVDNKYRYTKSGLKKRLSDHDIENTLKSKPDFKIVSL